LLEVYIVKTGEKLDHSHMLLLILSSKANKIAICSNCGWVL